MIFNETGLKGAYLIEIEQAADMRGFFARTWCEKEAAQHGLPIHMVQSSISFNVRQGTLRGLHYQVPPGNEGKLVRCTRGEIFDVIVDLRPGSKTFLEHFTVVLSEENHRALYVPPHFAHGFQTLRDNTEVLYQMTDFYVPDYARGARWDDPAFGIQWPEAERTILERDASYADFDPEAMTESGQ